MTTEKVCVIVVCEAADGVPELVGYDVSVNQHQYDEGQHYDLAKELANEDGYRVIFAFDMNDTAGRQLLGKSKIYGSSARYAKDLPETTMHS